MTKQTAYDRLMSQPGMPKRMAYEHILLEIQEAIARGIRDMMVDPNSDDEWESALKVLSKKLGKAPDYIKKVLDGRHTPSLKEVSDILFAMGYQADVSISPQAKY